ncbi:MAG: DUF2189 domain-containing protein [Alphaproteobacteria bacterium]|nr:MAG: DUF2189 domain-containing protein [Alphaproteobacteria bacterium]
MAQSHVIAGEGLTQAQPKIRTIGLADLTDALARGWDDFRAMPSHAVFLCLIYPIVGFVMFRLALGANVLPLLFPLAAGFALIGPLAALGLYEMSRRREQGLDVSWKHALDVFRSPSLGAIIALGLLLVAIFLVWIAVAQAIYVASFGYAPAASMPDFVNQVLTTPAGWTLAIVGNGIGFLFAVLVLTLGVVSFPLLLDRDVGVATAVLTSVRAVLANPFTMAVWGLIVAALLLLGSLPAFIGLAVVMPVLGHATWHLYRKVVEPDGRDPTFRAPKPREQRHAADFPAALFPSRRKDPA